MKKQIVLLLFVISLLTSCTASENREDTTLRIAAAISLQDALSEIEKAFAKTNALDIEYQFGSSGTLARQIEKGMDVDVFLSSNERWMDDLEEKEFIQPESRTTIVKNELVLVTNQNEPVTYERFSDIDIADLGRVAVGNPATVPAGEYTEEALVSLESWDEWESNFIFAKDVRQVLSYVESGNVDHGFVYRSDAEANNELTVVATVPSGYHTAIVYPGAIVRDSANKKAAEEFLEFLHTETAQEIFETFGFGGVN